MCMYCCVYICAYALFYIRKVKKSFSLIFFLLFKINCITVYSQTFFRQFHPPRIQKNLIE